MRKIKAIKNLKGSGSKLLGAGSKLVDGGGKLLKGGDKKLIDIPALKDKLTDGLFNTMEEAFESRKKDTVNSCLLYTSPSPRDLSTSRMPSSA